MGAVTALLFFVILAMTVYAIRCRFFSHDCMFCKGSGVSSSLSSKTADTPANEQRDGQVHSGPRPLTVRVRHDGTGPGPDTEVFSALRAPRTNALQPKPLPSTHSDDDSGRNGEALDGGDEVSLKWRYI